MSLKIEKVRHSLTANKHTVTNNLQPLLYRPLEFVSFLPQFFIGWGRRFRGTYSHPFGCFGDTNKENTIDNSKVA